MLDLVKIIGLTFLAELGDKTMFSTAAIAMRSRSAIKVLAYSAIAFIIANSIAIALAVTLRLVLNPILLHLVSGVLFVALGIWIALSSSEEASSHEIATYLSSLILAEMGDKTQLTVFSLAVSSNNPLYVLPLALVGYVAANGVAILIVKKVCKAIPATAIKAISSAIMIAVGIAMLIHIALRRV